jgi:hypothetical protein
MPEVRDRNDSEDNQILLAFAPMHRSALGLASGLVLGILLAAATTVQVIKGGFPEPNLGILGQFFYGYTVAWRGVFVGFLWGFGTGFVLGYVFALLRNVAFWGWLTFIRSRAEMEQYDDFLDHL